MTQDKVGNSCTTTDGKPGFIVSTGECVAGESMKDAQEAHAGRAGMPANAPESQASIDRTKGRK